MSIKTIFSGNKKRATRVYALVYGDGRERGEPYKYENWPAREQREYAEQYRSEALYRINVYPKRGVS